MDGFRTDSGPSRGVPLSTRFPPCANLLAKIAKAAILAVVGGSIRRMSISMSRLPAARSDTTETFLANIGLELAALCTACGACFDACPMVDRIGLRGSDPTSLTDGLRRLAKGQMGSAETVAWVRACAKSGLCVAVCPERSSGLDAMLFVRIAKQRALNETRQLSVKHDPTYFPRIKAFARLQLTDEELEEWL